jgi:hypothetical protein
MMEIAARLPHSHRHYYDRDETISKTASLRDTHSEDKFSMSTICSFLVSPVLGSYFSFHGRI